jgi:hypothetical protein
MSLPFSPKSSLKYEFLLIAHTLASCPCLSGDVTQTLYFIFGAVVREGIIITLIAIVTTKHDLSQDEV